MIPALPHPNESERLQSLRSLCILDTESEAAYDNLSRLAATIAGTEIALVSLVDEHRQWFKSRFGLAATETPREMAFCAHAILRPDEAFVVENTLVDERFHDNPLVAGAPDIRFYAGIPLRSPADALPLGTLCAISRTAKTLTPAQLEQLRLIAGQVEQLLVLHRSTRLLVERAEALERARREAERANEAKSRFLATMSHDMRTPLAGLLGTMDLLGVETRAPRRKELVRTAADCATVLQGLVNDTLDLAKIESGTLQLYPAAFSPGALVEQVGRVVRPTLRGRPVELMVEIDPGTPAELLGDGPRCRQVLLNLLSNAAKFTKQGNIEVWSGSEGGQWTVRVSDTGPGIAAAALETIFEPFVQAQAGRDAREKGTGLGLSICQELCSAMGGTIRCTSELGRGTTFTMRLPLAEVAPTAAPAPETVAPLPKLRVLLAEDDAVCRMVGRAQLRRLGMEVRVVKDGEEALEALREGGLDLAFLDLVMPKCTGVAVARRWRAEETGPRLPIVALTGSSDPKEQQACLDAGMDGVLIKPMRPQMLERALREILAKRSAAA